ncbi:phenol 2-monooxygenase [Sphingomonas sp. UYEF23]
MGLEIDQEATKFPVTVQLERTEAGKESQIATIRANYVVGCDGARSAVRRELGLELRGDSANQAWGVMDLLAVTDFPDIRLKAVIQSADQGTIVLIPREGGYLARLYVELDKLPEGERVTNCNITLETLIAAAKRILDPYQLVVKEVAWWSVYEIGQRLCDTFDDVPPAERDTRPPRVFIAGDACHTHSAKAGQGMNVSMQDAFNLGWKLVSVLRDRTAPALLHSYSGERRSIAKELIDFDQEWAAMLSAPHRAANDPDGAGIDPADVERYFVQHGHYTAGTATYYRPSLLTGDARHQHLAKGLFIGTRFHSAPVVRLSDAKPMHLGHVTKADSRWRIFAFGGQDNPADRSSSIAALSEYLSSSPASPVLRYTPSHSDIDSLIDVNAIFQQRHRGLVLEQMPEVFLPSKGKYGLRDYEKMFCVDAKQGDIFDVHGINRAGCIVVVRPDQYVAGIFPLDAVEDLSAFFDTILLPPTD